MATMKIAISLERTLLLELDRLVGEDVFPNRSRAIQAALEEKLRRLKQSRLARECGKLDPESEKALAEEGLTEESEWSEY